MTTDTTKRPMPPYIPYISLSNFISSLAEHDVLPSHIDKSLMSKMSGSGKSAMAAALKSLNLVNQENEPTEYLKSLTTGSPEDYKKTLEKVVRKTYSYLFDEGFNIENTTSKQVEDKFRDSAGASGSTLTKCITFFLLAANAANISVSPHVKAPPLVKNGPRKKKKGEPASSGSVKPFDEPPLKIKKPNNMREFNIPLKDTDDGVIYLPNDLTEQQAKKAVKMANFILNNYYDIEGE